ncbi:MAG: indolepyruvate oxidoreductase subunit beta family protein, partial [Burkholderiaceae bacterium]|nr:indolepyruvate oxidoreductase subunit beta family protein [Burkholderiaceae bacterium]
PQRTTLLSSTARLLTVAEKMQMGDGRLDPARILLAGRTLCREAVFFDMAAETRAAGTVISSVLFGAIAASGVLPLARESCESTIRAGGLSVEASLAGFARGFDAVMRERTGATGGQANTADTADVPAATDMPAAALGASRSSPGTLAQTVDLGRAKLRDFQDAAYESLYEQRVAALSELERRVCGSETVSAEAARWLALWMAYEDLIRVADLKSRPQRLERIRREMGAKAHEPVVVREFFKPGVDEIAAILPPLLAGRVLAWGKRRGIAALSGGIRLQTTAIHGWLALRLLAALRRFRPRSSRYRREQAAIEGWLTALSGALASGEPDAHRLAMEIAQCPRLLKGYGETWVRGQRHFEALMDSLTPRGPAAQAAGARADRLRAAREAALRDPEGRELASALGLPPPDARVYPIRIVKRPRS